MKRAAKVNDVAAPYVVEKRLAPIKRGWRWVPLANVGKWFGGGTPSKDNPAFWASGTIPWVSPKDMKMDCIRETQDYINDSAVENSATNLVRQGAVLVVTRSGILRHSLPVAIAGRDVTINQDLKAVELTEDVLPGYLAWVLRTHARDILHRCAKTGTTVQNLDFPAFLRYQIPVAPLDEQRRIVGEIEEQLTHLEAGITALRHVRANLDRYRASVLAHVFRDDLPQVPLGSLTRHAGYGTSVKCGYGSNGVGVLRIPNISNGKVDERDLKRAPSDHHFDTDDLVAPGDLLIIRTNGSRSLIGRGAIVLKPSAEPLLFASYLIRFRLRGSRTLWRWIAFALESPVVRSWIEKNAASSAGQHNVSLALLSQLPLPVPSEAQQRSAVATLEVRLAEVERFEVQVESGLIAAHRLRQAVLAKYLGHPAEEH